MHVSLKKHLCWITQPTQHSIDTQVRITWTQLAKPIYYRPILISVVMRFLQQMTGITPILVYLEPIFAQSDVSLEPRLDTFYMSIHDYFCFPDCCWSPVGLHLLQSLSCFCFVSVRYDAAIVGAVRLLSVVVAASLMDKAGRKALLYTSSMLMFLSSLTLVMISHTTPCPPGPVPHNLTALDNSSHNELGSILLSSQHSPLSLLPIISTVVFIFGKLAVSSTMSPSFFTSVHICVFS